MTECEMYYIKSPISYWDKKHTDAIWLDCAKSTISETGALAWSKQARVGLKDEDYSRRVQYWHDRGYRLGTCKLVLL